MKQNKKGLLFVADFFAIIALVFFTVLFVGVFGSFSFIDSIFGGSGDQHIRSLSFEEHLVDVQALLDAPVNGSDLRFSDLIVETAHKNEYSSIDGVNYDEIALALGSYFPDDNIRWHFTLENAENHEKIYTASSAKGSQFVYKPLGDHVYYLPSYYEDGKRLKVTLSLNEGYNPFLRRGGVS